MTHESMIVTCIQGAEKSHKSFIQDILCPKYKSKQCFSSSSFLHISLSFLWNCNMTLIIYCCHLQEQMSQNLLLWPHVFIFISHTVSLRSVTIACYVVSHIKTPISSCPNTHTPLNYFKYTDIICLPYYQIYF